MVSDIVLTVLWAGLGFYFGMGFGTSLVRNKGFVFMTFLCCCFLVMAALFTVTAPAYACAVIVAEGVAAIWGVCIAGTEKKK